MDVGAVPLRVDSLLTLPLPQRVEASDADGDLTFISLWWILVSGLLPMTPHLICSTTNPRSVMPPFSAVLSCAWQPAVRPVAKLSTVSCEA